MKHKERPSDKVPTRLPLWTLEPCFVNSTYRLVASPLAPRLHPGLTFHVSGVPS